MQSYAVRMFVHVVPVHPSGQMIRSIQAFTPFWHLS